MRLVTFIVSSILTLLLIFILDNKWGSIPAMGRFLSPQEGFWQNAEPVNKNFSAHIRLPQLEGDSKVYIDDRLVPHIFASNESDAYFIQGYMHAQFRLWQMEFQVMAAAGRVSEVLGEDPRFIRYDREQRRLGMVSSAEKTVQMINANTESKKYYDAYTEGINTYISQLSFKDMPVEYKLMNYKPEKWSNLKTALFLKMMTKDLAGFDRDFEFTNARNIFSLSELDMLFPQVNDSLVPIVPTGTTFAASGNSVVKPPTADSLYFEKDTTIRAKEIFMPDRDNGSNNWALAGSKTASGAPILANDPHLTLSLPSIWFEMQITTPTMNVYGATFPGAPSVIIGFNDDIAFGFTNAQRDVKDYYKIKFRDASKKEYWFDSSWKETELRIEKIKVRGGKDVFDTVAYTVFGPVMYDQSFTHDSMETNAIALRWIAHEASDEGSMWFKLNRAKNYEDYLAAIKGFVSPAQNMLFASKSGDIALWQQGRFPLRWERQGAFIMPGEDSSYMWQAWIPENENPNVVNPSQGFIQSANQRPVDETYPYYIPGNYIVPRGITIHKKLESLRKAQVGDMMALQNSYYSSLAATAVPLLFRYINDAGLTKADRDYLDELRAWDFNTDPDSRATTIYQVWMDSLKSVIFSDDFQSLNFTTVRPDEQTMVELLLRDSLASFIDNRNTGDTESIQTQITAAFRLASDTLQKVEMETGLHWWKFKKPTIYHLLKTGLMPFARTNIKIGGWGNVPNAMKHDHGPSWRMIVHLTDTTEAYGIYPGGQSGNPGSRFYDNSIDHWAQGKYYPLWVMKEEEARNNKRVRGIISFSKS